ncbi:hypothetical protein [Campylobacter ureolyticus]|uniref:Uncharacterized protein n=1 Tax=Campylobacter ureolyticus TaxID=827 RepID=A0A9Q4KMC9_9BACT|nr:hypothetical protein [Campylobacter ureolyticus]MCZ6160251.1 hypothetical protein [Campylobacter ureolyticus]MCZ6163983.1 hypothetical protein [Campylobacter ureolyticus]MCZ6165953.1 hypothetical protein [Campylobacter ureolyticus]MCZ6167594.1 hypothetical protein [Campylobacter ureolyticus]MCZ6186762.1 hypothetical protein [Campylobacter ureolyticus]
MLNLVPSDTNYNVHPLIIKNKKDMYFLIMFIALFFYLILICIFYPSEDNFKKLFLIFPILGSSYLLFYIKQCIYNKKYIWFKSNTIEIKENGKTTKLIKTDDIIEIKRAIYLRDYKAMINQGWSKKLLDSKLFYLFCGLVLLIMLFLYCLANEEYIKPLLLTALAIFIIPICKFIAFLFFKFEFRFILYDSIIIYTKNTQISVTIGSNDEFNELKTYLLDKTGINLSKTKKYIVLNDK